MKNRVKIQERAEFLNGNKIEDEFMFRHLARKMVTDMPIEELHKLMKLTKTDPASEENQKALMSYDTPDWQKHLLHSLLEDGNVLFEAECNLP